MWNEHRFFLGTSRGRVQARRSTVSRRERTRQGQRQKQSGAQLQHQP